MKVTNEGDRPATDNEHITTEGLDLRSYFGAGDDYIVLKGAAGKIQKLWQRYCGISLRIDKLEAELDEIRKKLIEECPSFFETTRTLVGARSSPFRPKLNTARKSNVAVAARLIPFSDPENVEEGVSRNRDLACCLQAHCMQTPGRKADFGS